MLRRMRGESRLEPELADATSSSLARLIDELVKATHADRQRV